MSSFLKSLLDNVNRQPGDIGFQFSVVRFLFMSRGVASGRFFLMKVRTEKNVK